MRLKLRAGFSRDAAEQDFIDANNAWGKSRPFLYTLGPARKVVGYVEMLERDVEAIGPRNGRLAMICTGGLEFLPWNETVAEKIPGAISLHRHCPQEGFSQQPRPMCLRDRSRCVLGPTSPFKFYNVLWVEWTDHEPYRKGIGNIWADCQQQLMPQQMDGTLG